MYVHHNKTISKISPWEENLHILKPIVEMVSKKTGLKTLGSSCENCELNWSAWIAKQNTWLHVSYLLFIKKQILTEVRMYGKETYVSFSNRKKEFREVKAQFYFTEKNNTI